MSIASVFAQEKAIPKGGQTLKNIEPQPYIELPAPQRKGGMPLYEALNMRQTNRKFAEKPLSLQQISDLLWCANGVNREDGKRTAPSARNAREIEILVFLDKGVFLYIPETQPADAVRRGHARQGEYAQRYARKSTRMPAVCREPRENGWLR